MLTLLPEVDAKKTAKKLMVLRVGTTATRFSNAVVIKK